MITEGRNVGGPTFYLLPVALVLTGDQVNYGGEWVPVTAVQEGLDGYIVSYAGRTGTRESFPAADAVYAVCPRFDYTMRTAEHIEPGDVVNLGATWIVVTHRRVYRSHLDPYSPARTTTLGYPDRDGSTVYARFGEGEYVAVKLQTSCGALLDRAKLE
jgi:hypothetical protein